MSTWSVGYPSVFRSSSIEMQLFSILYCIFPLATCSRRISHGGPKPVCKLCMYTRICLSYRRVPVRLWVCPCSHSDPCFPWPRWLFKVRCSWVSTSLYPLVSWVILSLAGMALTQVAVWVWIIGVFLYSFGEAEWHWLIKLGSEDKMYGSFSYARMFMTQMINGHWHLMGITI